MGQVAKHLRQPFKLRPPVNSSKEFLVYWNMFVDDIKDRENLRPSHLHQLKILCDLCVEYDYLKDAIDMHGRVYYSIGRNGEQQKTTEYVKQMDKALTEIRSYSKMLGLVLVKDTGSSSEDDNEFE